MNDFILWVKSKSALAWFYVVFVFEILMVIDVLDTLIKNLLVFWAFVKPNCCLVHFTNIFLKKYLHVLLLLPESHGLRLILWLIFLKFLHFSENLEVHFSHVYRVSHESSEVICRFQELVIKMEPLC